jgi:hypothetical protein
VAEPGAAEAHDGLGIDPLVLPEHEAARQRRLAGRHPPAERGTRPLRDLPGMEEREDRRRRDGDDDRD